MDKARGFKRALDLMWEEDNTAAEVSFEDKYVKNLAGEIGKDVSPGGILSF